MTFSLEDMLKEKITLTNGAKKEADISVLMDEIDKLDYTERELKEGLEIFKELLKSIRSSQLPTSLAVDGLATIQSY